MLGIIFSGGSTDGLFTLQLAGLVMVRAELHIIRSPMTLSEL